MYNKVYFIQTSLGNVSCDEAFVCNQRSWCQSSKRNPPAKMVRKTLDMRRDCKLRSAKQDAIVRNAKKLKDILRVRVVYLSIITPSVTKKAQESPFVRALFPSAPRSRGTTRVQNRLECSTHNKCEFRKQMKERNTMFHHYFLLARFSPNGVPRHLMQ